MPDHSHLRCCEAYSVLKPKSIVVAKRGEVWPCASQTPRTELEMHIQDLRTLVRPLLKAAAPGSSTGGPAVFYVAPLSLACGSWLT